MKKLFALLLVLSLLAGLCGCANIFITQSDVKENEAIATMASEASTEAPIEVPTEPVETVAPEEPIDYENLVYDGLTESWNDAYSTFTYAVPQINLDSPEIAELNAMIMEKYSAMIYADDNGNPAYGEVNYEWNYCGDILTIVMRTNPYYYEFPEFEVYYISISERAISYESALLDAYGVSWDEFYSGVRQSLAASWFERVDEMPDTTFVDPRQDEFSAKQYQRTIAWDNVYDALPYVGADGSLYAVVLSYSLAGADAYFGCQPATTDYALPNDWETVGQWAYNG